MTVPPDNDGTVRHLIWRRFDGDDWAAFDALPANIRSRLVDHAYEPWTVNAFLLWRHFRRLHGDPVRAERAMLRHLDHCERLERRAFDAAHRVRYASPLPHEAARATVLRTTAGRATAQRTTAQRTTVPRATAARP